MNIAIGSAFRNAAHYVPRYLSQVADLKTYFGTPHTVRVIAVEGDSTDKTHGALMLSSMAKHIELKVVKHAHGQPWFGSTESPDRLKALSAVGNAIFDAVDEEKDDVLVYIESDLLWDAKTIASLIDLALNREQGFDVFAPMIFAGEYFYDIWGYRKDGERFLSSAPYHPQAALNNGLNQVDSVGSCLVMRSNVASACRIRNDYALVGWCEDARDKGFRIAVDTRLRIQHPC